MQRTRLEPRPAWWQRRRALRPRPGAPYPSQGQPLSSAHATQGAAAAHTLPAGSATRRGSQVASPVVPRYQEYAGSRPLRSRGGAAWPSACPPGWAWHLQRRGRPVRPPGWPVSVVRQPVPASCVPARQRVCAWPRCRWWRPAAAPNSWTGRVPAGSAWTRGWRMPPTRARHGTLRPARHGRPLPAWSLVPACCTYRRSPAPALPLAWRGGHAPGCPRSCR